MTMLRSVEINQLEQALRKKFRTVREALIALGIEPSLANDAAGKSKMILTKHIEQRIR
jgi:hypothetical protein